MTPCGCFDIGFGERIKFYVAKQRRKISTGRPMFDWLDRKNRKSDDLATIPEEPAESKEISTKTGSDQQSATLPAVSNTNGSIYHKEYTPAETEPRHEPVTKTVPDDDDNSDEQEDFQETQEELTTTTGYRPGSPVSLLTSLGEDVDDVFQKARKTLSTFEDEASEFAKRFNFDLLFARVLGYHLQASMRARENLQI